ncbi:hypothetical protein [Haloplasma contractile]|uniref:hypothetical protein n=1 Tax=Haloplasma contractile TaxID=471825 RepID=UPI0002F69154|nr:hypothetical protein [Haloplasma contractile]
MKQSYPETEYSMFAFDLLAIELENHLSCDYDLSVVHDVIIINSVLELEIMIKRINN